MAYQDRSVGVTNDSLTIRGYYLPGTTKRIPLDAIRSVRRVSLSAFRGKGRIWGTANPGYWANFDLGRPRKTVAFLVDTGKRVKPFVTPDDPDAFEAALREHGVDVAEGDGPGPLI
ncbi:MAG: PH domain-containing protein [Acidimicrobiales bacterium]